MRSPPAVSRHPRRSDDGFVVLVVLLVLATFALLLWIALQPRLRSAAADRTQALEARLDSELTRELRRLEASPEQAMARDALWARAHGNLLRRGLRELQALEKRRGELRRLAASSLTAGQRQERRRLLRQLDDDIRQTRGWLRLVQSRLESS